MEAIELTRLEEMRVQAQALLLEIDELASVDKPSDAEIERMDEATAEAEQMKVRIEAEEARLAKAEERMNKVKELRSFMNRPGFTSSGAGPTLVTSNHTDPYDLSEVRTLGVPEETVSREFRARARDAVEQAPEWMTDEQRQTATRHVDLDENGNMSAHYLRHGSPEYTDAFFRYIRTGEKRTALSTSSANGGYLIPFHLDPTVILTNVGSTNPFRQISSVATIAQNVWHGVSSAGVTAGMIGEATEVTDGSPTFAQPTITINKAQAFVQASREVVEDAIELPAQIARLFADARDNLEADKFATGNGTAPQPFGIVSALQLTTASRVSAQTNGSFGAVDVFALVNNLPARYQQNCVWLAHWFVYNLARQFGGANQPNFWVDLGPGIPSQMLGRSTYQSSSMLNASGAVGLSSATASSDDILILGDFSNFQIVDRVGMEVVFDNIVLGSNRRPTGEVSWTAFWRFGSDSVNDDAFRMLRV